VAPRLYKTAFLLVAASLTIAQAGCIIPFAANLIHAAGGDLVPAEYEGMEKKTVAIVTSTDGSQYSQDVVARELNRLVAAIISKEVDDVTLVRQDQIDRWRDTHGWDETDLAAIGRGVEADKVIGIEVVDLRLREGATLFRGRSETEVSVIDVATGEVEYSRRLDDFTYPKLAGQDITETTESRFRKLYLTKLSQEISRSFHPYDLTEQFASDSVITSW